jgi:hypothetical protein
MKRKPKRPRERGTPICLYCARPLAYAGQISCPHCGHAQRRGPRLRSNPPSARVIGEIPGRLLEIRYDRKGPGVSADMAGLYKHPFKAQAKILALANGGLLILPTGRKRLWVRLPH